MIAGSDRPAPSPTDALSALLNRPVRIAPWLRVCLALVVIVGGTALLLFGLAMLLMSSDRLPQPTAAVLVAIATVVAGAGFVHVGSRLLRSPASGRAVFGPRARRLCGWLAAALAVVEAVVAAGTGSSVFAASAVLSGLVSFWLFRPVRPVAPDTKSGVASAAPADRREEH